MSGSLTADPEVLRLLEQISRRTLQTASGGAKGDYDWKEGKRAKRPGLFGLLDTAVSKATHSVDQFHKTADQVANQFSTFAEKLIGGAALASVFAGAVKLGRSFSQMSDIGQTFNDWSNKTGGSMLDMA